MKKYRVVWSGVVEIEASSFQEAIDKIKSTKDFVLTESKFGAFDGTVSYTEPVKKGTVEAGK